jgi:membrane-associated phospholipid phosphatase
VCAGILAVLTALVWVGALTGLDDYAARHWMPYLAPSAGHSSLWSALRPYPQGGTALVTACNIWVLPGSVVVSAALTAAGCLVLYRRGHRTAALLFAAAWVVVNVAELIGKAAVRRPPLDVVVGGRTVELHNFASSFPSGHTARAVLLAALATGLARRVWKRSWPAALAWVWAAGAGVALVLNADHTPSDVAGGLLVALAIVAGCEWATQRAGA